MKRLGDGFYEQRLIREQIAQLTGLRFLTGYSSDETQYQALMKIIGVRVNLSCYRPFHELQFQWSLTPLILDPIDCVDDFVGTLIGNNTPTGGTTPEGSNLLKEWVKIFYGKETAHNCYGNASQGCGVYWNNDVSKPTVIAPNHPDLSGAK